MLRVLLDVRVKITLGTFRKDRVVAMWVRKESSNFLRRLWIRVCWVLVARVKVIEALPEVTKAPKAQKDSGDSILPVGGSLVDGTVNNVGAVANGVVDPPLRTYHRRKTDQEFRLQFIKVYRVSTGHTRVCPLLAWSVSSFVLEHHKP